MRSFWELVGFEEALDRWIEIDDPSIDVRFVVTEWVVGRADDPYAGMQRRTDVAANYWFGIVPESLEGGTVIVCGVWIDEESRSVRCDTIVKLSLPIA